MSQSEKIANTEAESPGVSKLGLPGYTWWNEALHGVARSRGVKFAGSGQFSYATSFPQPIIMGAAFDMDLIRKVAGMSPSALKELTPFASPNAMKLVVRN